LSGIDIVLRVGGRIVSVVVDSFSVLGGVSVFGDWEVGVAVRCLPAYTSRIEEGSAEVRRESRLISVGRVVLGGTVRGIARRWSAVKEMCDRRRGAYCLQRAT